jgi:hypothetical protein
MKKTAREIAILESNAREYAKIQVVDIQVPEKTGVIKVILPKDKKLFQTQERLDEVWIFLQDK